MARGVLYFSPLDIDVSIYVCGKESATITYEGERGYHLFKRETLPGEFWTAKPKKLRFALLNTVGKVIRHAGKTMLRLSTEAIRALFDGSRRKIPLSAPA